MPRIPCSGQRESTQQLVNATYSNNVSKNKNKKNKAFNCKIKCHLNINISDMYVKLFYNYCDFNLHKSTSNNVC